MNLETIAGQHENKIKPELNHFNLESKERRRERTYGHGIQKKEEKE
jgi:hypothetical protein